MNSTPARLRGSINLLTTAAYRRAVSSAAASPNWRPRTLPISPKPIFFAASQVGRWRWTSPGGPRGCPSGPAVAPVSRSVKPARSSGSPTPGICGPSGGPSFAALALQSSLANRLPKSPAFVGSMLFVVSWQSMVTPQGLPYLRQRVSVRRTSVNGCIGWPTTAARDWKSCASNKHGQNTRPLNEVARLASWATPAAHEAGGTAEGFLMRKAALNGACGVSLTSLALQATLAGWCTPTAVDGTRGSLPARPHDTGIPLSQQVAGLRLNGSSAAMASRGQLNPELSRWLMGFPVEWGYSGGMAMQSCRSSRRRSSSKQ